MTLNIEKTLVYFNQSLNLFDYFNGAKENRTLPPTLQKSVASLGTCGPEYNGRGEIRTHITYYVNRNQLCIHAVNRTNPCTPMFMLADGIEPPVLTHKRHDLQSCAIATLPY